MFLVGLFRKIMLVRQRNSCVEFPVKDMVDDIFVVVVRNTQSSIDTSSRVITTPPLPLFKLLALSL